MSASTTPTKKAGRQTGADADGAGTSADGAAAGSVAPPTARLSIPLIDAIGQYLATRPWGEVQGLMQGMQQELAAQAASNA